MKNLKYKVKRIIYLIAIYFLRLYWRVTGGRRVQALGEKYRLTPNTIFPTYRKFPLPKGDCLSEIVRYTDYVQLHSVCRLLMKTDKPVVIEVGAHHGAYAVIMGKIVKKTGGRIIAIEPDPISFTKLTNNITLNGLENTVICLNIAVSDKTGKQYLHLNNSQSKLSAEKTRNSHMVDVKTVSQIISTYHIDKIDLLLIDVEGAELPVLQGIPWASIKIETIFCELHPYAWKDFGYSHNEWLAFLSKHNYRVIDMYMQERASFNIDSYIGPTLFLKSSTKQ